MFVSCERELFCLASTETRMFIRVGDKVVVGGGGGVGEGGGRTNKKVKAQL